METGTNHTPGPWTVAPPFGTGQPGSMKQYKGKPYQEYSLVQAGERFCHKGVVHVYQGHGEVGSPEALAEQHANARLIAAAPELLEACRTAMPLIVDAIMHGMPVTTDVAHCRNLLCASIAKATGERAIEQLIAKVTEDACETCGDRLAGHEDESATHCRWCVTCQASE